MALPTFELHRPTTIEEATQLADKYGDDAVFHCGGTELLLVMKLGLAPYGHLIDVKPISELRGVIADDDLWIGATTTHRQIEQRPEIRDRWAGLAEMTSTIGNLRVRNVGTLGGNLCFAESHSDPATALLAGGATVESRRGGETVRSIDMDDFVTGPFETALRPGELLVGVRVPRLSDGAILIHRKIRFHERAAATVAISIRVNDNRIDHIRLAVGAVGNRAGLVADAGSLLTGQPVDALAVNAIDDLTQAAVATGRPVADAFGSADYKAHLLRVLVRRTIAEATALGTS